MDLTSPKDIKTLLENHKAKPLKGLGQNFLVNKLTLKKILSAANLTLKDTVLEIGPGIGTLTQELAKNAGKVIAIEKDRTMIEILKETLKDYNNIEIAHGDALQTTNYSLITNYKVVANLPYYITSPIIRMFLEAENQPECMLLMVQKEVAQRICATPPNMSILAVSVQFYAKAEIISYVGKAHFWPSPNVDSAIIKITPFSPAEIYKKSIDTDTFFKIVKAGFSHPRKQLANNFSVALNPSTRAKHSTGHTKSREEVTAWLLKNNLRPQQRAETLSVQDWINLVTSL